MLVCELITIQFSHLQFYNTLIIKPIGKEI